MHLPETTKGRKLDGENSVLVVSQSLSVSAVQRAAVSDEDIIILFNTVGAVITNLN